MDTSFAKTLIDHQMIFARGNTSLCLAFHNSFCLLAHFTFLTKHDIKPMTMTKTKVGILCCNGSMPEKVKLQKKLIFHEAQCNVSNIFGDPFLTKKKGVKCLKNPYSQKPNFKLTPVNAIWNQPG